MNRIALTANNIPSSLRSNNKARRAQMNIRVRESGGSIHGKAVKR
jgi:hypothetical protein